MKTYAGYYKKEIREKSSSGAIFCAIALKILGKGGIVYGVCMSEDNYSANFERISDEKSLEKILGSKYMQAYVGNTFINVKRDLDNGLNVLFSGTICQINGLKGYLNKEYENLYCIDVICHGTPSNKLWMKYLVDRERQIGKCNELNFRSKEQGWYDSGIKENKIFTPQKQNSYMNLFIKDLCLRPSCYKCLCKTNKLSDFTLGDLWGVHEVAPELNDDRGISVIFIRTKKAEKLFEQLKDELIIKVITYEQAVIDNPCEYKSSKRPKLRDTFYKDMEVMSYQELVEKYLKIRRFDRLINKVSSIIKIRKNL